MSRETLHLLLLTHDQNEAENIISLLRNSGKATRAHFVESIEDFTQQLQEKVWDLVITYPQVGDIKLQDLVAQINRLNKDLPVVVITDDFTPEAIAAGLRQGASTVLPNDADNLLVLIIKREVEHLFIRRDLRNTEIRCRETQKRCEDLLESSRDAIAYIHDGMHVFANQAYLNLFGYKNADDLAGMPIMDMIEKTEQQKFKDVLKELQKHVSVSLKLNSKGIDGEGKVFDMAMSFSPAVYSEEECTQVNITLDNASNDLHDKIKEISRKDLLTGLFNKPHFMSKLDEAATTAVRKGITGCMLYINIDHFRRLTRQYGINHSDTILTEVAENLKSMANEDDVLARVGEDVFCLLRCNLDTEEALQLAEQVRNGIEQQLIAVGNQTATLTVSIGVAIISETSSRSDEIIQNAHTASIEAQKSNDKKGNAVHLFIPQSSLSSEEKNIDQDLVTALKNNHLHLMFQPLLNIKEESGEYYEVHLRLDTPDGQTLSSGDLFSSQAISDTTKRKVDRGVIVQSIRLLNAHRAKGHNTKLFLNVSIASLTDETFANWLSKGLNASKTPKGSIIIQFYEDDAIRTLKQCQNFTHALLEKGIPTSISRFGCALNPMQNLKRLAVDYVKLDSSFTEELNEEESFTHLQKTLDTLKEEEKLTIIPLVEDAATMAMLWQTSVDFLQGNAIQAPQNNMSFNFEDV